MNFDAERFKVYIEEAVRHREDIKALYMAACEKAGKEVDKEIFEGPVNWYPERPYSDVEYLEEEGISLLCD